MNTLLHAEAHGDNLFLRILEEIFWHGFLDTLKIIPFLFLTYLLMEFIEHKASNKTRAFMERSGTAGPAVGGLLGALPQCGFSAAGANLYTARVITIGTLISIFLSTSDEMLPIMISGNINPVAIISILAYKVGVGIFVGFSVDFILRLFNRRKENINIDEICEEDNCHCENGVLRSALHHTLTVGIFAFIITLAINAIIFFVGSDTIAKIMYDKPVISHLISALLGLIPNCAVSIGLTNLAIDGFITAGTMLSGLFSGAGIGIAILFKVNKRIKENLLIIGVVVFAGVIFGLLADLVGFSSLLS